MAIGNPKSAYNSTNDFVPPGLPWVISTTVSSTVIKYSFDKVIKRLVLTNHAANGVYVRIGFTENGINGVDANYYYRINGQQTLQLDTRVKQLYLLRDGSTDCAVSLFTELTTIDSYMMPFLTGSVDGTIYWNGVG